jgi:hypothetical protein
VNRTILTILTLLLASPISQAQFLNVSDWAQASADFLVQQKVLQVPSDNNLRGTSVANRGELAAMLYRALGGGMDNADTQFQSWVGTTELSSPFVDIQDGSTFFYKPAVYLGYLSYGDGISVFSRGNGESMNPRFNPSNTITRAWTVKALLEAWNIKPLDNLSGVALFNDVPIDHPVAGYIYKAKQLGIVSGNVQENKFSPNDNLLRQEIFAMLYRLMATQTMPIINAQSFDIVEDCGRIGTRYEQPILSGVTPPSVAIQMLGEIKQQIQQDVPIYTLDLQALISDGDTNTFTDNMGNTHTLNLFAAWKANGGCFIDITPAGEIPFSKVRWIAPDGYSPNNGQPAQYQLTVYAGDNLGSEVSDKVMVQLPSSSITTQTITPNVSLGTLPNLIANNQVTLFGTAKDNSNPNDTNYGIREVRLEYAINDGEWEEIATNISVSANNEWQFNWWLPNITGNIQLRTTSRNLIGNISQITQTANIAPQYLIEGFVLNNTDAPIENATVEINTGDAVITDNLGWFLFKSNLGDNNYTIKASINGVQSESQTITLNSTNSTNLVTLRLNQSGLENIVSGQLLDNNGKPLSGVTITIGDKTVTTDSNGNYQISGLPLGTYTVTASKEGYSFSPTQVTLDTTNTNPKIDLKGRLIGDLAQIAVGVHSCQDNSNQILLLDKEGKQLKNYDSTISGKGIDVVTTDWDLNKTVDFLVASELFKGNNAFVFDTSGKKIAALPVSTLNKGVKVVFGKFENGATAIVINQADDKKLYFYPNGKEPYSLDVLKNAADVNIVTADLDGDGIDEIIVLSAKQINGTNVLILDSKGKSKASLLLILDGVSATTKLPGLVGTTFVDQGKTILALANTEGSTHQVALYSIDKEFKATFVKNFAPFETTDARRKNEKVTVCHNGKDLEIASSALPAHLGHGDTSGSCSTIPTTNTDSSTTTINTCNVGGEGLLLSSNVQDNKPVLLVAQNGSSEIKTFDANGGLLKTLPLNTSNQAITSIAGTNIDLTLPVLSTLPAIGVPLKDVAVIGTPEKPLEVDNYDVEGRVHFDNTIIVNIRVNINAKVTFGRNVRFKHKHSIAQHVDLSEIFSHIQQPVKKAKKVPVAINLNQSIVINAPTILQQIQSQIPAVQQEQTTGNLTVEIDQQRFTLKPTKIKQGDGSKSKGFNFEMTGKITFVTEEDHEVELVPTMEEVDQLSDTLEQGGIGGLEVADSGQVTALPTSNPEAGFYSGVPEIFSMPVDDSTPEGLQAIDAPNLPQGNQLLRALIFKDKQGKKRKQIIYPYFGQSGMGQIDLNGIVSLMFNNVTYRGMLDYGVIFDLGNNNGSFSIQPQGNDFAISYPSGGKQTLFSLK